MAKKKNSLPPKFRRQIISLFEDGKSTLEVYDEIYSEAVEYLEDESALEKYILPRLKREAYKHEKIDKYIEIEPSIIVKAKPFNSSNYMGIIDKCMKKSGKDFEKACNPLAVKILEDYEGFSNIEDANEGEGFHNPPFDFLGRKDGRPYIVEFKGSKKTFNTPGETQKRRLKEIRNIEKDLNIALLQINLGPSKYRISYNEELYPLFDGRTVSPEPILKWIRTTIQEWP